MVKSYSDGISVITPKKNILLACDGGEEATKTARIELDSGEFLASRYKIIEELGKGGMGRVYKAYDTGTEEIIAVKVLHPGIVHDQEAVKRFCNELRLSRKISHRNVCRMFDLQNDGRTHFITMEYVDGEDLKSTLERTGPLSPYKILSLAIQIVKGLREGHRLGIVHRDLKSRNIMLDKTGRVHILDYGIARGLAGSVDQTQTGSLVGTPGYIAPEQAEGVVDYQADIYSLGVILYEAASGFMPFQSRSESQKLSPNKFGKPLSIRRFNPQFPEKMEKIIFQCLEFRPQERYQTADAVLNDLYTVKNELDLEETPIQENHPSKNEKIRTIQQVLPVLRTMKRKRIFETLAAFIGGGWLLLEFVHWILIDHYHFSELVLDITLVVLIGALISTLIWRWHKAEPKRKTPLGARIAIGLVFGMTIFVVILIWNYIPPPPPHPGHSLAVIPFSDLSGNNAHMVDAMTEAVISKLRAFPDIRVVPRYDIERISNYEDLDGIAKKLRIKFIAIPKFWKENEYIQVYCDLWDVGKHVYMKTLEYEDNTGQIFEIQNQLSRDIAAALESNFYEKIQTENFDRGTLSLAAYDNYWLGRDEEREYRKLKSEENFVQSRDYFLKALSSDPQYSKAYWGLGNLYEARWVNTNAEEDFGAMVSNYQTAYDTDPSSAEARIGLGWTYFYLEDWDKACTYFFDALKIDPDNYDVHYHIGSFLRSAGLIKKAVRYYNKTLELDNWHIRAYQARSYCHWYLGEYKKGLSGLKPALALYPDDARLNISRILHLLALGKHKEALEAIQFVENIFVQQMGSQAVLNNQRALLLALKRNKPSLSSLIKKGVVSDFYQTLIHSLMDDKHEVIDNIRREMNSRIKTTEDKEYKYFYLILKHNFIFRPLHDEPEFKLILKQQEKTYKRLKSQLEGL